MLYSLRHRGRVRLPVVYALTVLGVLVALLLELGLLGTSTRLSLTLFSLAVASSAWFGGFGPGALALVLSTLSIDYFLLEPQTLLSFGREEVTLALYVAGWLGFCALADRVYRRMHVDREARLDAERVARQADRLAQLTAALGQARTPAAVIEAAVQEPLHALKADAGLFFLISDDGTMADLARAVAWRQEDTDRLRQVTLAEKSPVSDAVGRGAPVVVESRARWMADYTAIPADLYCPDCQATLAVPLVLGSRVLAVVRLDFKEPRTFTPDDHEYLFVLGPRASQALDRTWQYEFAQRARIEAESLRARADQELSERQKIERALRASEARYRALAARTSRLHGLTAALSEAVTLNAVAQAVVHQGRIAVGATSGEVTLLVDNATRFETLYSDAHGAENGAPRRLPVESGLCATEAVQTRRPVFVGSFAEWQERFWRSASLAAGGGYVSSATLPLLAEGTAIGVLAFYFTVPVNFDESYEALLISVAQHCAQALDRARLYEAAQQARSEAEAANRLKDEFVSVVSHELRTPLNAILGWATMLQRGALEPPIAGRALHSIHDNATRQAKLIDDLLDFSRLVGGRSRLDLDEIYVPDLIRGVVESMIPTAAAHALEIHVAPTPPVLVIGDVRRLEQVFFNLIGNALKFTPAGGRILIETHAIDRQVEVRVTDTGAGIDPEFLPHVFDRFRQADSTTTRNHGGLGLGLSIARQLVEAHKGSIAAESRGCGCGSTFIVRLPSAGERAVLPPAPDERVEEQRPAAVVNPRLAGIRVLIVEDELDSREIMAHALQGCGAEVLVAGNARDALDILEAQSVDVLLADIAMPEEDGYAFIRKVRASSAPRVALVPAAAVTAHAREDERREALAAGFHLHLAKPLEPSQLTRTVERLARGSAVVH